MTRRYGEEVAAARSRRSRCASSRETALKRGEILQLVEEYQAYKAERGVVDFADQMALGARLAEECPEVAVVERSRYKVVLLDEYQDTSVSQRRMLTALFAGAMAGSSGHRGRRPVPGDLRLARRVRREPGRVPRAFPATLTVRRPAAMC